MAFYKNQNNFNMHMRWAGKKPGFWKLEVIVGIGNTRPSDVVFCNASEHGKINIYQKGAAILSTALRTIVPLFEHQMDFGL
jgi:hypothetical protein